MAVLIGIAEFFWWIFIKIALKLLFGGGGDFAEKAPQLFLPDFQFLKYGHPTEAHCALRMEEAKIPLPFE